MPVVRYSILPFRSVRGCFAAIITVSYDVYQGTHALTAVPELQQYHTGVCIYVQQQSFIQTRLASSGNSLRTAREFSKVKQNQVGLAMLYKRDNAKVGVANS